MPKYKMSEETKLKHSIAKKLNPPKMAFKKGNIPWNKGLTKKEDGRLNYCYPTAFKSGNKHVQWKHGVYTNNPKEYKKQWYLQHFDKIKESSIIRYLKNRENPNFIKGRNEYRKQWRKKNPLKTRSYDIRRRRSIDYLKKNVIEKIYKDNIDKYGILTCYLCEKHIQFDRYHIEHKIPVSRNGTNDYNNLAIACIKCNCSKGAKTEKEYKVYLERS